MKDKISIRIISAKNDIEVDSPLCFQMTYTELLPRREMVHKGPADLELEG